MTSHDAANDGLRYPADFTEFLAFMERWHRARESVPKPGEHPFDALRRTGQELEDVTAMARQVWANARRYQWLRDTGYWYTSPNGSPWVVIGTEVGDATPACGQPLDAAVDAGLEDTDGVAAEWHKRIAELSLPQQEREGGSDGVEGRKP